MQARPYQTPWPSHSNICHKATSASLTWRGWRTAAGCTSWGWPRQSPPPWPQRPSCLQHNHSLEEMSAAPQQHNHSLERGVSGSSAAQQQLRKRCQRLLKRQRTQHACSAWQRRGSGRQHAKLWQPILCISANEMQPGAGISSNKQSASTSAAQHSKQKSSSNPIGPFCAPLAGSVSTSSAPKARSSTRRSRDLHKGCTGRVFGTRAGCGRRQASCQRAHLLSLLPAALCSRCWRFGTRQQPQLQLHFVEK